jgi:hypothetical protein
VDELSFSTSLSSRSSYPLLRCSLFEQNQTPTCHHNHAAEDFPPKSGSAARVGATMFAITVRAHHSGLDRSEAMWRERWWGMVEGLEMVEVWIQREL